MKFPTKTLFRQDKNWHVCSTLPDSTLRKNSPHNKFKVDMIKFYHKRYQSLKKIINPRTHRYYAILRKFLYKKKTIRISKARSKTQKNCKSDDHVIYILYKPDDFSRMASKVVCQNDNSKSFPSIVCIMLITKLRK